MAAHRGGTFQAQEQNHRAKIEEIGRRLVPFGVHADVFRKQATLALGCFDKKAVILLRPFDGVEDARIKALLQIGIKEKFFPTVHGSEAADFLQFLKFLRTPEGQSRVNELHYQEKLLRRGQGVFTAAEMGWLGMFDTQRSDLASRVKDLRSEHKLQTSNVKAEMEAAASAAVPLKFLPAGSYEALNKDELKTACWDEYLAQCAAKGVGAVEHSLDNLHLAVDAYCDVVRKRHILAYLEGDNARKVQLRTYINERIEFYDNEWKQRPAKRFRNLLFSVTEAEAGAGAGAGGAAAPQRTPEDVFDGAPPVHVEHQPQSE